MFIAFHRLSIIVAVLMFSIQGYVDVTSVTPDVFRNKNGKVVQVRKVVAFVYDDCFIFVGGWKSYSSSTLKSSLLCPVSLHIVPVCKAFHSL